MHFDDRLATVLRLPEAGDGLARIQYQQLIDILGALPVEARSASIDAGFARLVELSRRIPAADRIRMLRRPLQGVTNPRLLAVLAEDEAQVAGEAIARARLDESTWLALVPALPTSARGVLRHRGDMSPAVTALLDRLGVHDRGLPDATGVVERAVPTAERAVPVAEPAAQAESSETPDTRFAAPTGNIAQDQDVSDDVLELLDLVDDPPPPTSLSEWARARAALQREQAEQDTLSRQTATAPSGAAEAGIGAIVRRIEEFRKARRAQVELNTSGDAPRLPLGDHPAAPARLATAIDFGTDVEGRIDWAEGPHAPSIVGVALTDEDVTSGDDGLGARVRRRLPLRGHRMSLDGAPAVAGAWQVDAVPRFDALGGRFTGYVGRLRRPPSAVVTRNAAASEAERLREVLHELRTPANAIQVAAEIIQQQLYGPAPHGYRALAAAIAGDCAHILAGFEELERLARLETHALELEDGTCDLAPVLAETLARLRTWTQPRQSGFTPDTDLAAIALPVAMERSEAERLAWRLFAALAGSMAPGEHLAITLQQANTVVSITIALPAGLCAREGDALFSTPASDHQSLSTGMFGTGFSLRLAAAEAAAAGGGLQRRNDTLVLSLPALTAVDAGNSTLASNSH